MSAVDRAVLSVLAGCVLAVALMVSVGFGVALLGDDVLGLWEFDSGLGSENGDPRTGDGGQDG